MSPEQDSTTWVGEIMHVRLKLCSLAGVVRQVLIVDDDPLVLSVTGRLLTVAGFSTLQAVNGAEGLAIYTRDHPRIGVVILDMSMPVMDGPEYFSRLREISPDVKVILSTGYAEAGQLEACAALSPHAVVEKPFDPETLIDAVRSAGPTLAPPKGLAWRTSSLSRRSDAG